jgi:phosphatidylserine/phosphatidylglycerophosphate/cardiolipin synthase-like enzyme
MRNLVLRGAWTITVAVLIVTSTSVPSRASTVTTLRDGVTVEAVLQDPTTSPSFTDMRIHDRVLQMVNETPAGATIRFPLFSLTWRAFTDAVIAAKERGVNVYVAGNGKIIEPDQTEYNRLREALGSANFHRCYTAPTDETEAFRGCLPARPNSFMHSKFYTFSQTGTKTNVVAVTSTNMTYSQMTQYNDMIITSGDAATYDGYVRYFDDLFDMRRDNDYTMSPNGTVESSGTGSTSYFSPRADSSGGTKAELATDSVALTMRPLAGGPDCSMKVMIASYESARSPVTDQLVRLKRAGCDVRMLYTNANPAVLSALTSAGIPVRGVGQLRPNGVMTYLHNKMYIMTGTYEGVAGARQVYMGSHNWLRASLRSGDEVLMGSEYAPVVNAYDAYFERTWAAYPPAS